MKTTEHLKIIIASTALLASAGIWAEMTRPHMKGADFDKKLLRDTSEMQSSARMVGGYADVVQRILPSVVSIGTYSKKSGQDFNFGFDSNDWEHLPPMFRDFLGTGWDAVNAACRMKNAVRCQTNPCRPVLAPV